MLRKIASDFLGAVAVLREVRESAIVTWGTLLRAPGWRVSFGLGDGAGGATEHSNTVGPWMGWDSPPTSLQLHPWAYYPKGKSVMPE